MIVGILHIKRHERALRFRRGDFEALLGSGTVRRIAILDALRKFSYQVVDTLETKFEHRLLDILVKDEGLRDALHVIELQDAQRALDSRMRSGRFRMHRGGLVS